MTVNPVVAPAVLPCASEAETTMVYWPCRTRFPFAFFPFQRAWTDPAAESNQVNDRIVRSPRRIRASTEAGPETENPMPRRCLRLSRFGVAARLEITSEERV